MPHHVIRRALAQLCIAVANTALSIAAVPPLTTQATNLPLTVITRPRRGLADVLRAYVAYF